MRIARCLSVSANCYLIGIGEMTKEEARLIFEKDVGCATAKKCPVGNCRFCEFWVDTWEREEAVKIALDLLHEENSEDAET